jgi:hypothetical protein
MVMTLSLAQQMEQRYRALREQSQGSTASAADALRRAADVADALAVLAIQAGQPVLAQTCSEVAVAHRTQAGQRQTPEHLQAAGQRWPAATNPIVSCVRGGPPAPTSTDRAGVVH